METDGRSENYGDSERAPQTDTGRLVNWVETADEYKFSVAYPDYAAAIGRRHEFGQGYAYRLSIYNERGTEVDFLEEAHGGTLQELHELARHRGTNADEILDKLLERVGGIS